METADDDGSSKVTVVVFNLCTWCTDDSRQESPAPEAATASGETAKEEEDMTEEERIAQLGKPKLGDLVTINVHIRESIEFKVYTDASAVII